MRNQLTESMIAALDEAAFSGVYFTSINLDGTRREINAPLITKAVFRRARVLVKLDSIHATSLNCCAPGYGQALRLALDSSYDVLAARLSGFSTTARSRITLYPLPAFD